MASCYHPDIVFHDPAFGTLKGKDVADMWRMLIARSKGHLEVSFADVKADDVRGSAQWTATYEFSKTKRKVVNVIHAEFEFKDGLIVRHTDSFNVWKWSAQALRLPGLLLGWTGFLQQKIRKQALQSLRAYQARLN
ncbi:nuclear transport factor 2 family protein [Flavobacterium caeni]|uniref:SnoaL-like domain-containing protein n=1 Tax=Flavobacterium caeni TaxID=490189 RepID=A0A1G5BR87_9FLAO|nr:nuclear transport factor 2 family protein [Flavobacterium caeni]SCX92702.1 SnoaL-like domain-containing protein [Flavobacterium caeni]